MGKIFTLGNSEAIKQLGFPHIEMPDLKNDVEIHRWLVDMFKRNNIEKLVVELGNNPELSLKIGYHIRLTLDELRGKALIPLLYVSTSTLNTITVTTGIWSHLFATKGVYFSSLDNRIKQEATEMHGISRDEYKNGFLNIIKVLPDEAIGRHSLANIWGAHSMDKTANTYALAQDAEFKKELYFKYVAAGTFDMKLLQIKIVGNIPMGKANLIQAPEKKILLIDDEADKGWETVLRKVFKTSSPEDFVVIKEKVKDYDGFSAESKKIIETTSFDLYLIDLRLNGTEEEKILHTADFSGMKVMQKIKNLNEGNQVIMFTASNKAWNLKALLDAGADGYYMKESPEYNFTKAFSEQNYERFQEDVKSCFEKDYLKNMYNDISCINKKLSENSSFDEIKTQLNLFWDMILRANTRTQFAYTYVTLYMVIEIINNLFIKHTSTKDDKKWEIKGAGLLLDWKWNKELLQYENTGKEITGKESPEWQKFAGLYFQKWGKRDHLFVQNIYRLIQKRNGSVHNVREILDKQNTQGEYLNRDVYTKDGTINLFKAIKDMILQISNTF